MDWTPRTPFQWDWESFTPFSGKESEISRPCHVPDWKAECTVEINNGSPYPSGNGACSGSEVGSRSSNSSFAVSDGSLAKAERQRSELNFESHEKFPENLNKVKAKTIEVAGVPSLLAPKDPLIGLKLGKRAYFENASSVSNTTTSLASKNISSTLVKKTRVHRHSTQSYYCQVQGCNFDLSAAKEYHRKHRVCVNHSKSPKVVVDGQERRFCQQCSRFHALSEFDEKKRSCRRRLSDHNARRRKPPQEIVSFSSFLPFNDNRRQMNLAFGHDPFSHATIMASSTWDGLADFKLTQSKGSWIESGSDTRLQFPTIGLSNNMTTVHHDLDKLLPFKGSTAEVLNQGIESSSDAHNSEGGPLRHAPSLLSTDSWGSSNLGHISNAQVVNTNDMIAAHPAIHAGAVTNGFWQADQTVAKTQPFNLWKNGDQFLE